MALPFWDTEYGYRPDIVFPENQRFSDWNNGRFEAIFVAFHPFFRIQGVSPFANGWIESVYTGASKDKPLPKALSALSPEAAEILSQSTFVSSVMHPDIDEMAAASLEQLYWAEIGQASGMTVGEVNAALRTSISGLRKEFAKPQLAQTLMEFCRKNDVFPPSEGRFQPLHAKPLQALFRMAGHNEVFISADPHPDGVNASSGLPLAEWADLLGHGNRVISPDKRTLALTHWDGYYALFCGDKDLLSSLVEDSRLDGFWADSTTDDSWWMDADQRALMLQ